MAPTRGYFDNFEQSLSTVTFLRLTGTAWLSCDELKPVECILAAFRERGGRVQSSM